MFCSCMHIDSIELYSDKLTGSSTAVYQLWAHALHAPCVPRALFPSCTIFFTMFSMEQCTIFFTIFSSHILLALCWGNQINLDSTQTWDYHIFHFNEMLILWHWTGPWCTTQQHAVMELIDKKYLPSMSVHGSHWWLSHSVSWVWRLHMWRREKQFVEILHDLH